MEKSVFQKLEKESKVEMIDDASPRQDQQQQQQDQTTQEFDLSAFLEELKKVRQPVSAVPTYTPKNFLQQFVFYESGATRRLYIYLNGGWYYASLT